MNRWHSLFILLTLGLAITLGVACVAAVLPRPVQFDSEHTARIRQEYWDAIEGRTDAAAERVRIGGVYRSFGLRVIIVRPDVTTTRWKHWHRAGWPLVAFEGRETITGSLNSLSNMVYDRQVGFMVPLGRNLELQAPRSTTPAGGAPGTMASMAMRPLAMNPPPMRMIPLRPVWGGLALNTMLFAATLYLLILMRRHGAALVRRLRGRCPRCAYDLSGTDHEFCPECGARFLSPPSPSLP